MKDCVFCKIAAGELPAYKVYEDDDFVGFLDIRPYTKGQVLLIPKWHFRWVDDVDDFGGYFERAKAVGLGIRKVLKPWTVFYITHGIEMEHAHIKIIPRYKTDRGEALTYVSKPSDREMKEIAKKIKAAVKPIDFGCDGGECSCGKGGVCK